MCSPQTFLLIVNLKKGGLITGGAVLGVLLLGPKGMAIGGVIGKHQSYILHKPIKRVVRDHWCL